MGLLIKMTYEYSCSLCGSKHVESHQVHMHLGEIPRPHLPMGWHIIDNHIICSKHEFSIYDILRLDDQRKKEREDANASASKKPTVQEGQESQGTPDEEGKEIAVYPSDPNDNG